VFLRKLATDSSREEEEGPFDQKIFEKKIKKKKKLRRGGATASHRAGEVPVFFFPISGSWLKERGETFSH